MSDKATIITSTVPQGPGRAKYLRKLVQTAGIGFFYLIVLVFFSFSSEHFFTYSNAVNVLTSVSVIGIVSLGQALAIIAGGFDLSVGGVLPLGAVLFALLVNAGFSFPAAVAIVVATGALIGLFNGLVITKIKINPLIATLGTLSITGGLAFSLSDGVTIPIQDVANGWLADFVVSGISYYLVIFVILALAVGFMLRFSVFGRMLYSVGGNREASHLAGIRVDLVAILVYVICAALASFAGVVVASQLLAGSATVGADAALSSIAAVVLGGASLAGGVGGISGTMIGVLILGTIANGMVLLQVPAFYQQIATGAILLLGVGFSRLREVVSRSA
jgi:ribose transport system permease protein